MRSDRCFPRGFAPNTRQKADGFCKFDMTREKLLGNDGVKSIYYQGFKGIGFKYWDLCDDLF
jgi:hypothetical protein